MIKTRSGFTIVELLIVIVVIAILAAVSIVAYTGVQQRARNSGRAQNIAAIQKGLELFRAERGRYPQANAPGTNLPAGFSTPHPTNGGYSFSVATDDSWLRELRQSGFMPDIPKDPVNSNSSYFFYFAATSVGSCTEPVYALVAVGWEGGTGAMPPTARTLNCSITSGTTAAWAVTSTQAVFSNLNKTTPD